MIRETCIAIILACFIAVTAIAAEPPPPMEFDEALALVLATSPELEAAGHELARRQYEAEAADGLRWPTIDLDARATRIDGPIEIDLDPIRQTILALHPQIPASQVPPFEAEIQSDSFFEAQARATWPLYTGGRITAARNASRARVDEAVAGRHEVAAAVLSDLVDRYYGFRLADDLVAVRREVLAGVQEHHAQAVRLEEEGFIAPVEVLHAEVAVREADRELEATTHDRALAAAALQALLGTNGTPPDPASPLFLVRELPDLWELQLRAEELNPALSQLVARRDQAQCASRAARGARYPDVALFGVRELYQDDLTLLDPGWAAGVAVRFTVFDGFARGKRIAAARELEARLEQLDRGARRDISLLVEQRYRALVRARDQYDALDATVGLAEESLRARQHAFEEGFATSLDVIDARTTLAGVQLARSVAAHDFVVVLADLAEAVGEPDLFLTLQAGPHEEML